jgi:hypothetical protein
MHDSQIPNRSFHINGELASIFLIAIAPMATTHVTLIGASLRLMARLQLGKP